MTKQEIIKHNQEIRAMNKRNDDKLKKTVSDQALKTLNSFFGFK